MTINTRAALITAGAGVPLATLEAFAHEQDLSLGTLSPGARALTLGTFLEGPYAGLRHVVGGRLDPVTTSLAVMLPDGRMHTSHPAPRHAAGPDLDALFLGGEGRFGLVVEATVRLLPRAHARAWTTFSFPDEGALVGAAGLLLQSGAAVETCVLGYGMERWVLSLELAGTADSVERDMTALSSRAARAGGRPSGQALGVAAETPEHRVTWDEAAAAVREQGVWLRLFRPAVQSVLAQGTTGVGVPMTSGAWHSADVGTWASVAAAVDPEGVLGGVPP